MVHKKSNQNLWHKQDGMKEKESIKRLYAFTNQKEMVCAATLHEGSIPFLYN